MFSLLIGLVFSLGAATWDEAESRLIACHDHSAARAWFDLSERVAADVRDGRLDEDRYAELNSRVREVTSSSYTCEQLARGVQQLEEFRSSPRLETVAVRRRGNSRARRCRPAGASCSIYAGSDCCSGTCVGLAGIRWGIGPHRCY